LVLFSTVEPQYWPQYNPILADNVSLTIGTLRVVFGVTVWVGE